jgi:hypothetical protein
MGPFTWAVTLFQDAMQEAQWSAYFGLVLYKALMKQL